MEGCRSKDIVRKCSHASFENRAEVRCCGADGSAANKPMPRALAAGIAFSDTRHDLVNKAVGPTDAIGSSHVVPPPLTSEVLAAAVEDWLRSEVNNFEK